jgi:hypothetical protein
MHAYQLPKGGAGIDALVKVERPNPKPAYRQVLVKVVRAATVACDGRAGRHHVIER